VARRNSVADPLVKLVHRTEKDAAGDPVVIFRSEIDAQELTRGARAEYVRAVPVRNIEAERAQVGGPAPRADDPFAADPDDDLDPPAGDPAGQAGAAPDGDQGSAGSDTGRLENMTVNQLKGIAAQVGVDGSQMKKEDLIKAIEFQRKQAGDDA
jgi:hypothetical protein